MTVHRVTNDVQLRSALTAAAAGDTVLLAAGSYGQLAIANRNFSAAVSIKAELPGSVFVDGLDIRNSSQLSFAGLSIGHALGLTEYYYSPMIRIDSSASIKFAGVSVHGSLDGDPANDGRGISVTNVTGLTIEGSTFSNLNTGIVAYSSERVIVTKNVFETIQADGIDSAGNVGVVINGNVFRDFKPAAGDHPDAIQFFNTGQARGQSNITIEDNIIAQGSGAAIQGIYLGNPGSFGYANVLIRNNFVYIDNAYNGILLYGVQGGTLLNNTTISNPSDSKVNWIAVNESSGITLGNNLSDQLNIVSTTLVEQFNNQKTSQYGSFANTFTGGLDFGDLSRLTVPTVGYQAQRPAGEAPVAGILANALSDLMSGTTSQSLFSAPEHSAAVVSGHGEAGPGGGTSSYDVAVFPVASSALGVMPWDHFSIA